MTRSKRGGRALTAAEHGHMLDATPGWSDSDREELVEYLESDQLVTERSRPVPRQVLSRRAAAALWALRVFVVVVGAMVIYTFFANLS
jgi:uncharacterized protein involved in exopolysaccharide biosynthesis